MKSGFFTIFILIFGYSGFSQTYDLSIQISELKMIENSVVRIAVYDSKESYFESDQIFRSAELVVDSDVVNYTFKDMPGGTYAITIYHDEDNDGEMDRKWFGPPKEGYAFSNNYHSTFKPASFEDAAFHLDEQKKLSIQMRY